MVVAYNVLGLKSRSFSISGTADKSALMKIRLKRGSLILKESYESGVTST